MSVAFPVPQCRRNPAVHVSRELWHHIICYIPKPQDVVALARASKQHHSLSQIILRYHSLLVHVKEIHFWSDLTHSPTNCGYVKRLGLDASDFGHHLMSKPGYRHVYLCPTSEYKVPLDMDVVIDVCPMLCNLRTLDVSVNCQDFHLLEGLFWNLTAKLDVLCVSVCCVLDILGPEDLEDYVKVIEAMTGGYRVFSWSASSTRPRTVETIMAPIIRLVVERCPDLRQLCLDWEEMEGSGGSVNALMRGRWPELRYLRLFGVRYDRTSPWTDQNAPAAFFDYHSKVIHIEAAPEWFICVQRDAMPLLKAAAYPGTAHIWWILPPFRPLQNGGFRPISTLEYHIYRRIGVEEEEEEEESSVEEEETEDGSSVDATEPHQKMETEDIADGADQSVIAEGVRGAAHSASGSVPVVPTFARELNELAGNLAASGSLRELILSSHHSLYYRKWFAEYLAVLGTACPHVHTLVIVVELSTLHADWDEWKNAIAKFEGLRVLKGPDLGEGGEFISLFGVEKEKTKVVALGLACGQLQSVDSWHRVGDEWLKPV